MSIAAGSTSSTSRSCDRARAYRSGHEPGASSRSAPSSDARQPVTTCSGARSTIRPRRRRASEGHRHPQHAAMRQRKSRRVGRRRTRPRRSRNQRGWTGEISMSRMCSVQQERDRDWGRRVVLHLDHHETAAFGNRVHALAHVTAVDSQRGLEHRCAVARTVAHRHLRAGDLANALRPPTSPAAMNRPRRTLPPRSSTSAHPGRPSTPTAPRIGMARTIDSPRCAPPCWCPSRASTTRRCAWLPRSTQRDGPRLHVRWPLACSPPSRPLPVYVVCDDDEVARWASAEGAEVLWSPERGLNGAVDDGVNALRGRRHRSRRRRPRRSACSRSTLRGRHATMASRSCPTVTTTAPTWPACLRTAGFRFAYGPGSFRRHGAEARRLGLPLPRRARADPRMGRRPPCGPRPSRPRRHPGATVSPTDEPGTTPASFGAGPRSEPARAVSRTRDRRAS